MEIFGKKLMHILRAALSHQMRGGPISLAEFMQDVLTSPHGGFYMHNDVFGASGHFITSPEVSQMFGEIIGAWAAHTWMSLGSPRRVALVELGPGRGTLMADMVRATAGFKAFSSALELHLVEVSPALRQLQWEALRCSPLHSRLTTPPSGLIQPQPQPSPGQQILSGASIAEATAASVSKEVPMPSAVSGLNKSEVTWHHVLDTVPRTIPAIFIAHEFFDALPVHQFVKDSKRGWLEKLVDVASSPSSSSSSSPPQSSAEPPTTSQQSSTPASPGSSTSSSTGTSTASESNPVPADSPPADPAQASGSGAAPEGQGQGPEALRLVLSPHPTPASALLVPLRLGGMDPKEAESCEALEVSAHGMASAETLALRVAQQGGAALVIDYGRDGHYGDSLMAIKGHKGVEVLQDPGSADLSAWVDFAALRIGALRSGAAVRVSGPASQASFLLQLGLGQRLQALIKKATPEQVEGLMAGFRRLTDQGEQGMGHTYQVLAITREQDVEPAGFDGSYSFTQSGYKEQVARRSKGEHAELQ